jgi:hypothetical protein
MTVTVALITLFVCTTAKAARPKKPAPQHSHRFLVAQALNKGLRSTPLARLGFVFEAEGHRRNLSPFFLVGASGTESSLGAASCRGNPKNLWGLGSCDRYWKVPYFETWKEAIGYYADFIRGHWPTARTVYDLHGYCECGSAYWGGKTSAWMAQLFGDRSGSILYPKAARP